MTRDLSIPSSSSWGRLTLLHGVCLKATNSESQWTAKKCSRGGRKRTQLVGPVSTQIYWPSSGQSLAMAIMTTSLMWCSKAPRVTSSYGNLKCYTTSLPQMKMPPLKQWWLIDRTKYQSHLLIKRASISRQSIEMKKIKAAINKIVQLHRISKIKQKLRIFQKLKKKRRRQTVRWSIVNQKRCWKCRQTKIRNKLRAR